MFQLPYVPELLLRAKDIAFLDHSMSNPLHKRLIVTKEELEIYKSMLAPPGAFTPPVNYYRNLHRHDPGRREIHWKQIHRPTLILFGDADSAIAPETAAMSAEYVSGPCRVKYLKGITHWCHMEVPDEVNRHITEFLQTDSKERF